MASWLKSLFGLHFLRPDEVADAMPDKPQDPRVEKFSDYLLLTYIQENATFPPKMWASCALHARTTNVCERFHSRFSKNFYHPHPNIHDFTDAIKEDQVLAQIKARGAKTTATKTKKEKDRQTEMQQTIESFCGLNAITRKQ